MMESISIHTQFKLDLNLNFNVIFRFHSIFNVPPVPPPILSVFIYSKDNRCDMVCPFFHCLNRRHSYFEIATSHDDIPCVITNHSYRYRSWRCDFYSECPSFVFSAFISYIQYFSYFIVICSVSPYSIPLHFIPSRIHFLILSVSSLFLFVFLFCLCRD